MGRKSWLFAGSLRSGKRAAAIMTLIQSVRLNGHDPHTYLNHVSPACRRRGRVRLPRGCHIIGWTSDRAYFNAEICGLTPSDLILSDFDYYLTKGASGQMFVRFACLIEWIHMVDYWANLVLIQEFVHSVK